MEEEKTQEKKREDPLEDGEILPIKEIGDQLIYQGLKNRHDGSAISATKGLVNEAVVEHPTIGAMLLKWFYDQRGVPQGVGTKLRKELGLSVNPFHPHRLRMSQPISAELDIEDDGLVLRVTSAGIDTPDYMISDNRLNHMVRPTVDMSAVNREFKRILNRSRILDSYI